MNNLHDTIYDLLTDFQDNEIPKLEVLDRIMIEVKKDIDTLEKTYLESDEKLTELAKLLLDNALKDEKQISKLTRKLLKV